MKKTFICLALSLVFALLPATPQAQITLPWSETFSGPTAGGSSLPANWTRIDSIVSGSAVYPNLMAYGSGDYGNVLNLNANGTPVGGSGMISVATPLIPAPLNQLEIRFNAYKSGLKLYAATSLTNQASWVLIGTYSPGYAPSANWPTYEIRTDTVTGMPSTQGYLVVAGNAGTSYGSYANAYMDNLQVLTINSCERPSSVTVETVGPNGATISWPEVEGAPGYTVYYGTVNNIDSAMDESTTGTSAVLTDLVPNTQYYVWVKTDCAGGSSDARTATFTTEQSCYSLLNLVQTGSTFNAASFAWTYSAQGNASSAVLAVLHDLTDPTIADVEEMVDEGATSHIFVGLDNSHQYQVTLYTLCGGDTAEGVSSGIYFRNCGESPLSNGGWDRSAYCPVAAGFNTSSCMLLYDADILFSMDTIRGIALHRYVGTNTAVVTRTLNIYMGHTALDSLTSNPGTAGLTQVAANHQYSFAVQEWDTLLFDSAFVYSGNSNVLVAIEDVTNNALSGSPTEWYWHNAETKGYHTTVNSYGSATNSDYHRPDIRFVGLCNNELNCNPPVVAMGEVDSMNAEVNWYGDGAAQYVVEYRMVGETTWEEAATLADNSYTLTGLTPASYYEVRVGVVCDTVVRYSVAVQFETQCALMHLPFHFTQQNMVAAAENGFSSCWNFSQYVYRGRLTDSHRGYVRNVDFNQWIMLPAIVEPLSGARLRTWMGSSDHGYYKVGIVENGNMSTVVWVDTVEVPSSNVNTAHNEYVTYLDSYTGMGNRIVISPIVNNSYHYMYFFDFHVEEIEDCRPVVDLTLDSASATTLSVSWSPRGGATQWAVCVNGARRTIVSGQPHCTLTGLNPYTEYEVSVRSLCGDDSSALASDHFRTTCTGEQCSFSIDAHAASGEGWMGAHLKIYAAGEEIEDFTMLQGSNLSRTYSVCASMPVLLRWLSGNEDSECSFELRNGAGDTLYSMAQGPNRGDTLYTTNNICSVNPGPGCADRYARSTKQACDSYLWRGRTLTTSGIYTDTVAGAVAGGCDSIYLLDLTVNYSISINIDTTAEESFLWGGTTYTQSGNYTFEDTTAMGCDSTVTLNLVITHAGCDNVYDTVAETECDGYSWHDVTYTSSGTYSAIVAGVVEGGCDSIYVLQLTVNHSATSEEDTVACDSYLWHGQTFIATGSYNYIARSATAEGCDSIYTLALTIHHSVATSVEATAQGSYSWNGQSYTQSGDYTWTGTTTEGCDSTVTLLLTITQGIDDIVEVSVNLFPNPTTGKVSIHADGLLKTEVYDAIGRRVMTATGTMVDLSNMAAGSYTLRIVTTGGTTMRRVLKMED